MYSKIWYFSVCVGVMYSVACVAVALFYCRFWGFFIYPKILKTYNKIKRLLRRLCTQVNMMFVMLLWLCIHTGQAEKFAWARWESIGGRANFSACPVWMHNRNMLMFSSHAKSVQSVQTILEIVRRSEETTGHSVWPKWNRGLLFVRPECIGVRHSHGLSPKCPDR
jgi:hypothetical protein